MAGRPNSLLKAAPPSGPSITDVEGGDDAARVFHFPFPTAGSHPVAKIGYGEAGEGRPWVWRPRPVAPSSRISPPEPVAAPGKGEMAVGWLLRLDLAEQVDVFGVRGVFARLRVDIEAAAAGAGQDPRRCPS